MEKAQQERLWKALLGLAVILNIWVITTSDPGLDAHLAGAHVDAGDGRVALDWGDVRTADPSASDPMTAKSISEDGVLLKAGMGIALLGALLAIGVTRWKAGALTAVVLALNPSLIFGIGRGYGEHWVLAFFGLSWLLWHRRGPMPTRPLWILGSVGALCLPVILPKYDLDMDQLVTPVLLLLAVGFAVDRARDDWLEPRRMLLGGFAFGTAAILALGLLGKGSFSVVMTHPLRFLSAWPFAFLDVVLIYGAIGMVLWPFARGTWAKMDGLEDRVSGELCLLIGTLSGVIVTYVACLWTYESVLWDSEWPWHMWTMGNNGRYITILAIPAYLLVQRVNGDIDWNQRQAVIGIALILPLSLAAGLHGQTYWTDEAAEAMELEAGEDFLFVHEATLGMHYLYTFHAPLDAAENDITGHWRAPESGWADELENGTVHPNRGNITSVSRIVIAPDVAWPGLVGWELSAEGQADFMNGGGTWRVYAPSET